jgi:hypothetical protein
MSKTMKPRERSNSSNATMKRIKSQILLSRGHRDVLNILSRCSVPLNSTCSCAAFHQLAKFADSAATINNIKKDQVWVSLVRDCSESISEQDVRGICKVWWSFNKLGVSCPSEELHTVDSVDNNSSVLLSSALDRTTTIAPELDAMGVANCLWGIAKAFGDQTLATER